MGEEPAANLMNDTDREVQPLGPIARLFEALNENEIQYCHWKGTWHMDRTLRGLTDLDILIDRNDSLLFRRLLCQQGFKPVVSPPVKTYPGMEDYLGYDGESGRLVHLHIYYQLILGEPSVKNYRLPLEQCFLESKHSYHGVHTPSPELETIVLTIRALLRYRGRRFLKSVFSPRHGRMPDHVLKELDYLLRRTTLNSISRVLASQIGFFSPDVLLDSLSAIMTTSESAYALHQMRRRLRRELAPYERFSRGQALIRYVRAQWASHIRPRFAGSAPQKKTMSHGGITVAVIGADGAGKSTVVNELSKWLSWRLTVRTYYMGSKQPSKITRIAGWGSRIFAVPHRISRALIGERNAISELLYGLWGLLQSLHRLGIARDRYERYIAGRRDASQGAVVLYDRYPINGVRIADRFMDGPRIASMHENRIGPVVAAASRLEEKIYRGIRPPDHLFVLQVSPGVSSQRKPDHEFAMLEAKSEALNNMERDGLHVTQINADQPLDQVLLEVKTRLWNLL